MRIIINEFMNHGVHLGHGTSDTKMSEYLLGVRNKRYIIDLESTLVNFSRSIKFIRNVIVSGGETLFVTDKVYISSNLQLACDTIKQPYVHKHWVAGYLSNRDEVLFGARMNNKSNVDRYIKWYQGIENHVFIPGASVILGSHALVRSMKESNKCYIPTVSVVDSNRNPNEVTYIVPGNDDSMESLNLYLEIFRDSIGSAQKRKVNNFYN